MITNDLYTGNIYKLRHTVSYIDKEITKRENFREEAILYKNSKKKSHTNTT